MVVILCVFMLLSLAPAAYVGFKKKRFYLPFLLVLLYYCIQIPLMLNNFSAFTENDIYLSCFYVLVCNTVFSLLLVATESRLTISPIYDPVYDLSQASLLAIIASLILLLLYVVNQSGLDLNDNTWTRREESYFSLYGPIISYSGFLIFGLWTNVRGSSLKILLLPILALVFFSTGARVIFMVLFGAFWLYALRRFSRSQIIMLGGLAGVGFIALHVVTRVLRSVSLASLLAGDLATVGEELYKSEDLTGGDGSIGEGFVLAMRGFEDQSIETTPLATLIRLILLPFPTTVVPFKPDDITYKLWRYGIESGYFDQDLYFRSLIESYSLGQNGSLHPVFWGDALLNAGWIGCFVWPAMLVAALVSIEKLIMSRPNTFMGRMTAAMAAPGLTYVIRGNVFIGIVIMVVPIAFAYGLVTAKKIFLPRQVVLG